MIKKRFFFLLVFFATFLSAEPSAFELQSGATKNDISNLQSSSKNLQGIATDLQNRLNSVEQAQEGLKTLVEGQNLKIKRMTDSFIVLQNAVSGMQNQLENMEEKAKDRSQDIEALRAQLEAQQEEIKKIQYSIQEINRVMTENNNSIIQQLTLMSQFLEKNQKEVSAPLTTPIPEQEEIKKEQPPLPAKSNKEKFAEAKALVQKKDYDKSEDILNYLIKENYKSAECYYMLGDIAYRKKNYKSAVDLYKKSATIDEKASYMPILLWRTAWSFKYLKDDKNHQGFLDLLARMYPESEQGKKAIEIKNKTNKKEESEQNKA
ncbi:MULTISPECIES: tetratricopeptide repeat protein [unclassified Helicobacter]|uniref:tetratricopeptide repeat protein n=1 Tax=unclassified Helicobacter TaxID=2593540 RepID=UPI000CF1818B|nr:MULTISPECIES: tetratricopeptide repeat protein [unclassified Helicobacter]